MQKAQAVVSADLVAAQGKDAKNFEIYDPRDVQDVKTSHQMQYGRIRSTNKMTDY